MQRYLSKCLIVPVFFSFGITVFAQEVDYKTDFVVINKSLSDTLPASHRRSYLYQNDSTFLQKANPVHVVFGTALYIYQNLI
jgi:predicted small integral membrane protein